jgi:hypothetical protein
LSRSSLLGLLGLRRVGPALRRAVDGSVEHRLERLHPGTAEPVALVRVQEVVEEVGQLHHVAVGVEDDAVTGVGHGTMSFRLPSVDNANHTDPTTETQQTHAVAYSGTVQYALRELSAWVEHGVVPPPTSEYRVQDGQVHVPASAAERKGIQPVVHLEANGGERAEVAAGEAVTFTAQIEVPPAPGKVVSAKWDFEGAGSYPDTAKLGDLTSDTVELTITHTYVKPGTYFPALRVASQREGNPGTPFARSLNLSRVRILVRE